MGNQNLLSGSRFVITGFLAFAFIILLIGCGDETNHITNYIVDSSLTDPGVQPKIVFTKPANGAVGPFSDYDQNQNLPYPKFTIQLNKLVDVTDLRTDAITLRTDDFTFPITLNSSPSGDNPYGDPNLRHILIYRTSDYYKYVAGKTYTVTVDTTLEDIHGNKLAEPYVFSFIPEPEFRVYYGYPNYDEVSPIYPPDIFVNFNSKVDTSIFQKMNISPPLEGRWVLTDYYYYEMDSTYIRYVVDDTLLYDTEYTVSVGADARDINGMLIREPYEFSFTTSPFEVRLSSYSIKSGPGGFTIYNDFEFEFNGFVDTSSVKQAFSVTPFLPYAITFLPYGYGNYRSLEVNFQESQMQPSTTYKMTLDNTVQSINGTYMKNPYSYSFTTGY